MITPPLPPNENSRLQELLSLDILDTAQEKQFDEIVELANEIFKTPITLISLVDANRQWFKAKVGLDACETERDISFCTHAISSGETLIVKDALNDERFKDNPFVLRSPFIRFYAGVPLKMKSGHSMGTLCLIDFIPRKFGSEDQKILEKLARQVVSELELKSALRQLLEKDDRIRYLENLENLMEMSNGLSHEINNPLTSIFLGINILNRRLKAEEGRFTYELSTLQKMVNSAQKIENILVSLKNYARDPEKGVEILEFKQVLDQTLLLIDERLRHHGIDLCYTEEEGAHFTGVRSEIIQVVHQLLMNSIDAIKDLEERWIHVHVDSSSSQLSIRFTDSGRGLDKMIQRKLMHPFFSTKDVGKGLGLGLSVCRKILETNHGSLCYSEHEGHTSFIMTLPV
jgi:two-component system, NtrC family, sensor kinase